MGIEKRAKVESLSYFSLAALLVVLFIPTVGIWNRLTEEFGKTVSLLIPVVAAAVVFGILFVTQRRHRDQLKYRWPILCVATLLAIVALVFTDPQFPAKRIHLVEYMLIAFVVRRAICRWVSGVALVTMTLVIGILFGVHDELIQGMHPDRTFGHRDIAIDGISAIAGSLAGHGTRLFEGLPQRDQSWSTPNLWIILVVTLSMVVFLYPLPELRDAPLPWWTLAPLFVAGITWHAFDRPRRALGDPASLAGGMLLAAVCYPLLTHVTPLTFH